MYLSKLKSKYPLTYQDYNEALSKDTELMISELEKSMDNLKNAIKNDSKSDSDLF